MSDIKIFAKTIDGATTNQIYTMAKEAAFENAKIRIMPDTHAGIGAVVGFTATLGNKIIPNVIGVDIGCGMRIYELGKIDISYQKLDEFIKKNIPAGSEIRREHYCQDLIKQLKCFPKLMELDRLYGSLGTLGGGNHFIEIDADSDGNKYLVIHTGSRNLGTQVAKIYQKMAVYSCKHAAEDAKEALIKKYKKEGRQGELPDALSALSREYFHKTKIPEDLCYLEGYEAQLYLDDMKLCQEFAVKNREKIGQEILSHLGIARAEFFESVHNFIGEDNIIRKGAIPAYKGQKLLIPLNMRDGCIMGIGRGNEDWNYSAPHGAGRLMSRQDAKHTLELEQFLREMSGIYTTTANRSTLDESPMAYKNASEIIELVSECVDVQKIIKPLYNFKAAE